MRSPNLMLHCGATEVPRTALNDSNIVQMPPKTRTYCPIEHDGFVNLVQDKLADVGFRFGTEAHALTKEGKRYFGLIHLLSGKEFTEHALVLGIRNSIDKSFPASIVFGASIFVCDNLCFDGEVRMDTKHTTHIWDRLPNLVEMAVNQTSLMRDNMGARFEAYKERKLSKQKADHIIVDMLRHGAINTSRVEKVVNEWDEPSHDEFREHGRTAWRLHNATTEALKGAPLGDMPKRTMILNRLLDRATGFTPTPPIEGEFEDVTLRRRAA